MPLSPDLGLALDCPFLRQLSQAAEELASAISSTRITRLSLVQLCDPRKQRARVHLGHHFVPNAVEVAKPGLTRARLVESLQGSCRLEMSRLEYNVQTKFTMRSQRNASAETLLAIHS